MSALIAPEQPAPTIELPLAVAEIFGPTFQGEGPSAGQRCSFVRLGGCNLHCSWCDTPYTWDWTGRNGYKYSPAKEVRFWDADAVLSELRGHNTEMVVVTGGEPMLQQKRLRPLFEGCHTRGWRVEVETAGTVRPLDDMIPLVSQFNVSLKLDNSGNEDVRRCRPGAIRSLQSTGRAVWKFVIVDRDDLDEVEQLVTEFALRPVWVMPEGASAEVLERRARALADEVLSHGWNLTSRLQIQLWGDERGV